VKTIVLEKRMKRRSVTTIASLALLLCGAAPADKPMLTKLDLFEGDLGGYKLYRIPGIVVTKAGTLLAYCEARRDATADYGEITTMLRRSTDGGETWDKPRQIAHAGSRIEGNPSKKPGEGGEHEQTVNNPIAIADADGSVHFLYCVNYEHAFYMKSTDDGATFGAPVDITPVFETFKPEVAWTVIATGPSHGIQLARGAHAGRLLAPVWISFGPRGHHGPSVVATIYSDDHGVTWKRGDVAIPTSDQLESIGEPILVELSDGRVMINARNNSKTSRRVVAISPDGVSGWSAPTFDDALWEPNCAAGITNVPGQPGTLVFSNPHNLKVDEAGKPIPGGQGRRRNLAIKVSRDDGKTWISNRTLEEGTAAYSDLLALANGTVLCFYERDQRLTIARFNLAWALAKPADE
jgi:sialidase-1